MFGGVAEVRMRKQNAASSIANDPRRLSETCDMRSLEGRLFTDCYDAVRVEFPDANPLKLREIAVLKFAAEKAVASGAWEDVVRLHNLAARKEAPLRAAMRAVKAEQPAVGLRARLQGKYGGGAP
jgi:hypothetical protein